MNWRKKVDPEPDIAEIILQAIKRGNTITIKVSNDPSCPYMLVEGGDLCTQGVAMGTNLYQPLDRSKILELFRTLERNLDDH